MRELLVRGKNTIYPEVIDPGGRSVQDSPVKSDFTFTFDVYLCCMAISLALTDLMMVIRMTETCNPKKLT
jgi:hypothetical protein